MTSTRTRSLLLLLLILSIGMLMGAMIGGRFFSRRMEALRMMGRPEHLKTYLLDQLQLEPAKQAELDSILFAHIREASRLILEHRSMMRDQMDSLMQVLQQHLEPAEFQRLRESLRRMRPDPEGQGPPGHGMRGPNRDGRGQRRGKQSPK